MSLRLGSFGILALLLGLSVAAASPLKDPRRIVNGQAVDLNPLFRWWAKHDGERPLTAWVRLSGEVVATNRWGWVIEAQVEHRPDREARARGERPRIILQNPPVHDASEFHSLTAQLNALNAQHDYLSQQSSQAGSHSSALSKHHGGSRYNRQAATAQANQWKATQSQAKDQLKIVDAQLKDIKQKLDAYPSREHYRLDCLALDIAQQVNGVPLYDYGRVWK